MRAVRAQVTEWFLLHKNRDGVKSPQQERNLARLLSSAFTSKECIMHRLKLWRCDGDRDPVGLAHKGSVVLKAVM